jgi:hypothetical protein
LYTRRKLADPAINCSRVGGGMKAEVTATRDGFETETLAFSPPVCSPSCFMPRLMGPILLG